MARHSSHLATCRHWSRPADRHAPPYVHADALRSRFHWIEGAARRWYAGCWTRSWAARRRPRTRRAEWSTPA